MDKQFEEIAQLEDFRGLTEYNNIPQIFKQNQILIFL